MKNTMGICPWCGKYFVKKSCTHKYCSWECSSEVNHKKAVYRYYGKKFVVDGIEKTEPLPIVEKHEYTSELEKFRSER